MRTREDIIRYARELRREYHTQNPYKLAEHFGIRVVDGFHTDVSRKAFTVKMETYPTMIMLNAAYDKKSRMVLCAHELGHALLHEEGMNHFSVNEKNVFTNTEYEANLFAVSLLFNDDQFNMPISEMSNYILKSILDWNIREK